MPLNLLLIGHLVRVGLSMRSKPTPHVHLRGGSMDSRQAAEQCFNPRSVCWHRCQQRRPRPCAPNCYSTYSPSELVQGRRISALCFYNWRIDEGSLQVGCYMSVTKGVLCLSTMWLKLQSCGIWPAAPVFRWRFYIPKRSYKLWERLYTRKVSLTMCSHCSILLGSGWLSGPAAIVLLWRNMTSPYDDVMSYDTPGRGWWRHYLIG
jgi:hypothetical protein